VYFGTCGGCDFQQMNYAAQLEAKVGIIRDCLHRIAKIDYDAKIQIIPSPEGFGYRLRAQWHADTTKKQIGYYKRNSRDLVDIQKCLVLAPELNGELEAMRCELPWGTFFADKFQIDAALGTNGDVSIHSSELAEPAQGIEITAFGEKFRLSARSFFQGNRLMIDNLVETAIGDAGGETALDLYCGVGLFTLPLAPCFASVIGVEESEESIEFAERNAKAAGMVNAEFRVEKRATLFVKRRRKRPRLRFA
jgi:tRNA/tmRNA/rRNA uracil-C5-methylase (TrmA/RlmC/RlmD family)